MDISSTLKSRTGEILKVEYSESDPMIGLEGKVLLAVRAFSFCGDKMVLVKQPITGWIPSGGGIEAGEKYEDAAVREVKEETNMKVLFQKLIGFQDVYQPGRIAREVRMFCIVEPYGDFVADPDGDITEIKLIDPKDYKQYFDWGKVGERIMEQAIAFKNEYSSSNGQ